MKSKAINRTGAYTVCMGLEEFFGKKGIAQQTPVAPEKHDEKAIEKVEVQNAYYRKIIERYAALVNENEEKTVPELKALIDGNSEAVLALKKLVLEQVASKKTTLGSVVEGEHYDYEKDFLLAAEAAFALVRNLRQVHPEVSVSFWLAAKEILELEAGDVFDKAILLCSLLKGLGAGAAILVLELENNLIHPVVVFQYSGRGYLLDTSQPDSRLTTYGGALDEVLQGFSFDGAKFLKKAYEFDNDNYKEY